MGLMEFLSLPGQERTRRRDEFLGGLLNYYLGPTGIPERLVLPDMMNPASDAGRSIVSSQEMLAPGRTPEERFNAGVSMLTDIASIVAPSVGARVTGGDEVAALTEGLLNVGGQTRQGLDEATRRFLADESGALTLPGRAVGPAEERGQQIINMLTSGRAGDITDDMLDLGDPVMNTRLNQYLFENYDLPMDEASRMARARERFDAGTPLYTGVPDDRVAYDPYAGYRRLEADKGAIFAVDKPSVAEGYGNVMPVFRASDTPTETVDLGDIRSFFNRIPEDQRPYSGTFADFAADPDNRAGSLTMRDNWAGLFSENYTDDGWDVLYNRVNDYASDGRRGRHQMYQIADPTNIRSRFARFDPRLAHLRNLSAGVGGLGLLAIPQEEQ
jgi:hypothetical protein